MEWLTDAVRDVHGPAPLSWATDRNPKGVLHTTESSGKPDYKGWTIMPHLSVMPVPGRGVLPYQHLPFTQASFSLRNAPGGVETNRERAYQIELIGTCDPNGPGYYWPNADDLVLRALVATVIGPMSAGLGIPLRAAAFGAYPDLASGRRSVRMTGPAWEALSGWCGHQHVPENTHLDPGMFPWDRMIRLVRPRSTEDDIMPATLVAPAAPAQSSDGVLALSAAGVAIVASPWHERYLIAKGHAVGPVEVIDRIEWQRLRVLATGER